MTEIDKSFLAFKIERRVSGKDEWTSRSMEIHHKDSQGSGIKFRRGTIQTFDEIGPKVAIVQKYKVGMIEELGVDAVIRVDAPNLVLDEPFIFEQTWTNTVGMTLTGIKGLDGEKMAPDRSMESVMLLSGGEFIGPLQAGFTPKQEVFISIGKDVGNDQPVRLKVYDLRPRPAVGVPAVEPVSRL